MWIDGKGTTVLPATECKRLMAVAAQDGLIGRLAVSTDQAPVVIPLNFSLRDGQILLRVGPGFLADAADGRLVAFEVDHVDHVDHVDQSAWSVLARGLATLIRSPAQAELAAAAHPLVPEPGDMVLVVRPDLVTGRTFALRHQQLADR
jgi:nitroimidazol reductase NimA-like FMN-containing flavoprotein (pyridoxamine 5'-phosphate oxidase superfamily)